MIIKKKEKTDRVVMWLNTTIIETKTVEIKANFVNK